MTNVAEVTSSRYRQKRRTPISLRELDELIGEAEALPEGFTLDSLTRGSLVAALYYSGFRIAEVVGDSTRRWRVLTRHGLALSRGGILRLDWRDTAEGELWVWRTRGGLPGILKKDISREGDVLNITAPALKHGKREDPIQLNTSWPWVNLIVSQWSRAAEGERVWPVSQTSVREFISRISDGLYPHAFRASLATVMAGDSAVSVADMLGWFGWSRATTADAYIMRVRGTIHANAAIGRHVGKA